jgi:hypothetical protein
MLRALGHSGKQFPGSQNLSMVLRGRGNAHMAGSVFQMPFLQGRVKSMDGGSPKERRRLYNPGSPTFKTKGGTALAKGAWLLNRK